MRAVGALLPSISLSSVRFPRPHGEEAVADRGVSDSDIGRLRGPGQGSPRVTSPPSGRTRAVLLLSVGQCATQEGAWTLFQGRRWRMKIRVDHRGGPRATRRLAYLGDEVQASRTRCGWNRLSSLIRELRSGRGLAEPDGGVKSIRRTALPRALGPRYALVGRVGRPARGQRSGHTRPRLSRPIRLACPSSGIQCRGARNKLSIAPLRSIPPIRFRAPRFPYPEVNLVRSGRPRAASSSIQAIAGAKLFGRPTTMTRKAVRRGFRART